jgi:hypothetical protein
VGQSEDPGTDLHSAFTEAKKYKIPTPKILKSGDIVAFVNFSNEAAKFHKNKEERETSATRRYLRGGAYNFCRSSNLFTRK